MNTDDEPDLVADSAPANPENVASTIVLRQLSNSPKTRFQLAEKLAKKNTPEAVIQTVLDRFTDLGYIDDFAYAQMFIRSKMRYKHLSSRALRYELMKCGVEKEIISAALEELDEDADYQTALALVRKKLPAVLSLDEQTRVRRLMGALARKGFSPAISSRAVTEGMSNESLQQMNSSAW